MPSTRGSIMTATGADLAATGPAALIGRRATSLQRGDFADVYACYHDDAPFRRLFPEISLYLAYAAEQLLGTVALVECEVLRVEESAAEALVLVRQHFICSGSELRQFEVARCLRHAQGWTYHSGCRIAPERVLDPGRLSWAELINAGDNLWL